jgi:integrase
LYVSRTVNRIAGHGYVVNAPKTARSRRLIILPQFAVERLKEHKAWQVEARLKAGTLWKEQNLVFPNTVGGFARPDVLVSQFKKLLKDTGLPDMRFHDLRHSAATILLSMGVHAKVVQELLGHTTISMTMDTYSHVLPSMQQEAMGKLNDLFNGDNEVGG